MQIGIDLGATKIEYVLLDNQNKELTRNRISTPKDYIETIKSIISIIKDIERKNKENLNVGICHPGATDITTGLIKNAHNSQWLNEKNIVQDLKKEIKNNIYLEMMQIVFVYQNQLMGQLVSTTQFLELF